MFWKKRLACSFCGRSETDVAKLVAGPNVYICDRCVAAANRIMQGSSGDDTPLPERQSSFLRRLLNRIRRVGDRGALQLADCQAIGRW